ncbi:MAG: DUF1501 domain-containing protein [Acidobacteria bacterium]|nr:DUF1501 domain-containing protein [Acidobacteriota bacterium]
MTERQRLDLLQRRKPHAHAGFFSRPHMSRRQLFRSAAGGLGGYFLGRELAGGEVVRAAGAPVRNTARNVIFLFLQGAPSHVDTFDLKEVAGVTPTDFAPETLNGVRFPVGLMPRTAAVLDKVAIVRSGLSWALAHPLAQTWFQIGRNPTSALGRLAPHIGSVVAIEKEPERRPDQIFPAFIAFNPANQPGSGYLPQQYAPFKTRPNASGLASTEHGPGRDHFDARWELLGRLDGSLRAEGSPYGAAAESFGKLYEGARDLMYNPLVSQAFSFSEEESLRYGGTAFGDACLLAKKVVAADQGTRFIQVTSNGWDHHQGIYDRQEVNGQNVGNNLYARCGELDPAFGALVEDLEAEGLLDETLVVIGGEFGRTVGALTAGREGRDHYLQMFYAFAGGGVRGGRAIGSTDATGAFTQDPGWSRFRDVRPEDIEATIYSALGIDWTTVRHDDPLGRGFYYVPLSDEDVYAPVDELFV